jgi:hypothetical protein
MFYTLLCVEKRFILNTIVKEQGLEYPYQETFITRNLQVNWNKMQFLWFSWCACNAFPIHKG